MIANVSPATIYYEETLNTLNYANRAKNIRVTLKKNVVEKDDLVGNKLASGVHKENNVVSSLKNEIFELRKLLNEKNDIRKKSKIHFIFR